MSRFMRLCAVAVALAAAGCCTTSPKYTVAMESDAVRLAAIRR